MSGLSEQATESQLGRLRQFGYSADCPLTKAEAAHLISLLEAHPQPAHAGSGGVEAPSRAAYALRLSIEHTRRALAEAGTAQSDHLQHSLDVAVAKRVDFWTESCRNPTRMQSRSASGMELYMKHGCRFLAPTREQTQGILNALDAASPIWDRDNPELFYQTLELNFPELLRHALGRST